MKSFFIRLSFFGVMFLALVLYSLNFRNKNIQESRLHKIQKNNSSLKPIDAIDEPCSSDFLSSNDNIVAKSNYINRLKIVIPKSKKWNKNIFRAYIPDSVSIKKKYKKRFNANIFFNNLDQSRICNYPARIRLVGDGRDHITNINGNLVSSLDVQMNKGNFNQITSFKLFIPEARKGDSEIFTSLLLREMGFISPRTFKTFVDLNGTFYEALAQENLSKELVESMDLRESILLEINEELYWNYAGKNKMRWVTFSPKVINHKWLMKSDVNFGIGFDGLDILANSTNELSKSSEKKELSDLILSDYFKESYEELTKFRLMSMALGASHGLKSHNRRFYYDSFTKSLLPVYYDGNSKFLNKSWEFREWKDYDRIFLRGIKNYHIDLTLKALNNIDKKRLHKILNGSGMSVSPEQIEDYFLIIKNKLNSLRKFISNNKNKNKNKKYNNLNYEKFDFKRAYFLNKNEFYICNNPKEDCKLKSLSKSEIIKLIRGKLKVDEQPYLYSGRNKDFKINSKIRNNHNNKYNSILISGGTELLVSGTPIVKVNRTKKIIEVEIIKKSDKLVLYGGTLNGWKIILKNLNNGNNIEVNSRFDSELITASLTFKNIFLNNIDIYFSGGLLEDSINFVRAKGMINKVLIEKSFQDALDADFSDLFFKEIVIKDSGNDCIDFSYGKYYVEKINLNGCKDKAISVGEKSDVSVLKGGNINNSNVGFAVKDSSILNVSNISLSETLSCFNLYRKKQEFNGSYLVLNNIKCPPNSKKYIQNGSQVLKNFK